MQDLPPAVRPAPTSREETGLILVDAQERLFRAMPEPAASAQLANMERMLQAALRLQLPILVTEQYPSGLGTTLPSLRQILGDAYQPLSKVSFSCCGDGRIRAWIEEAGCTHWILIGMETHVCVYLTALDLVHIGKVPHVAADAVLSRTKQNWRLAIGALRAAGVRVVPVETLIFQLLGEAATDLFRQVAPLFKEA